VHNLDRQAQIGAAPRALAAAEGVCATASHAGPKAATGIAENAARNRS